MPTSLVRVRAWFYFFESLPGFLGVFSVELPGFFSDDVELDFESFESDFLGLSASADFL